MLDNKTPGKDISETDLIERLPLVTRSSFGGAPRVRVGEIEFGGSDIPIFAGPNMVESEELIVNCAKEVKSAGAHFLRGGAFKPLTFPYRSEKYRESGLEGLNWLATAKRESGLKVITEVMDVKHLDAVCLVADVLQIGSRNMQNFPLLIECAKTGFPIMLKRHYGASLRDWLGAAEYILHAGNGNLILCERGVSAPHTHRHTSRFLLDLQVVPAARELTHLPIIVDPSHATFWRGWVPSMAMAAIAAGADGVMLEVHPDPPNAAVDPLQSIDFLDLQRLLPVMNSIANALNRRVLF